MNDMSDGEDICEECHSKHVAPHEIAIRYIDGTGNTHDIPANAVVTFTTTSGEIQANIECGRLRIITMDGAMNVHPNSSNGCYVTNGVEF